MGSRPKWHQWIKSTYLSHSMPSLRPAEKWHADHTVHLVFAGRISAEKNLETLIEATRLLASIRFPCRLTIIGDGKLLQHYEQLCRTLDLRFVKLTGFVPRAELMESRFCDADILVLPSKEERQGKVLLEAMSCSIPTIASTAGGIPSIITDGENGLLFDPSSAVELSEKVRILSRDDILRERIVESGYQYAKDHALDREIHKIINSIETCFSN